MLMLLARLSCAGKAGAQTVAVKSDLLTGSMLASPNLGVELKLSERFTLEAGFHYNPFPAGGDRRWKHWFVQPELRYWMCQPYGGHFFGANLMYGVYNVAKAGCLSGFSKGYVPKDTRETLREWEYHTAITSSSPPAGDWKQASA